MQSILDTKGHVSTIPDSQVVLDLDLSGLGQSEAEFEQDSLDVFKENRGLVHGWDDYTQKRGAFFEGLLARRGGRIFQTEAFAPLEHQAQTNLARAIEAGHQAGIAHAKKPAR